VTRLSDCLDELSSRQKRVLELRAGAGSASPRTRRDVARILDLRVQRVRRIERRGLRRARRLDRAGACSSATEAGSGTPVISTSSLAGTTGSRGGGGGEESLGGGTSRDSSAGNGGSGDVRGERQTQLPPPIGAGRPEQAEATSLWVAVGLMLLAAVAGFATPALRDRLRGGAAERTSAG
jgi:hypothetical protein